MDKLPFGIGNNEYAMQVRALYAKSCQELWDFNDKVEQVRLRPYTWLESMIHKKLPDSPLDELGNLKMDKPCTWPPLVASASQLNTQLVYLLQTQSARHQPIIFKTAQAVHELAEEQPRLHKQHPLVQRFLRSFHKSRIGSRVLISHCVALSRPLPIDNMVGVFCKNTNFDDIACLAGDHAHQVCMDDLGECPPIDILVRDIQPTFTIPAHVEYVLFELLKNAMRATVEHQRKRQSPIELHPVHISWESNLNVLI